MLSMCKYYASEVAVKASVSRPVARAAGYMEEHPTEMFYRDARQLTIVEGTSRSNSSIPRRPRHDLWWD